MGGGGGGCVYGAGNYFTPLHFKQMVSRLSTSFTTLFASFISGIIYGTARRTRVLASLFDTHFPSGKSNKVKVINQGGDGTNQAVFLCKTFPDISVTTTVF